MVEAAAREEWRSRALHGFAQRTESHRTLLSELLGDAADNERRVTPPLLLEHTELDRNAPLCEAQESAPSSDVASALVGDVSNSRKSATRLPNSTRGKGSVGQTSRDFIAVAAHRPVAGLAGAVGDPRLLLGGPAGAARSRSADAVARGAPCNRYASRSRRALPGMSQLAMVDRIHSKLQRLTEAPCAAHKPSASREGSVVPTPKRSSSQRRSGPLGNDQLAPRLPVYSSSRGRACSSSAISSTDKALVKFRDTFNALHVLQPEHCSPALSTNVRQQEQEHAPPRQLRDAEAGLADAMGLLDTLLAAHRGESSTASLRSRSRATSSRATSPAPSSSDCGISGFGGGSSGSSSVCRRWGSAAGKRRQVGAHGKLVADSYANSSNAAQQRDRVRNASPTVRTTNVSSARGLNSAEVAHAHTVIPKADDSAPTLAHVSTLADSHPSIDANPTLLWTSPQSRPASSSVALKNQIRGLDDSAPPALPASKLTSCLAASVSAFALPTPSQDAVLAATLADVRAELGALAQAADEAASTCPTAAPLAAALRSGVAMQLSALSLSPGELPPSSVRIAEVRLATAQGLEALQGALRLEISPAPGPEAGRLSYVSKVVNDSDLKALPLRPVNLSTLQEAESSVQRCVFPKVSWCDVALPEASQASCRSQAALVSARDHGVFGRARSPGTFPVRDWFGGCGQDPDELQLQRQQEQQPELAAALSGVATDLRKAVADIRANRTRISGLRPGIS